MTDGDINTEKPPLEIVLKVANRFGSDKLQKMRLTRYQAASLAQALFTMLMDKGPDSTGGYIIEVG